MSGKLVIVRHGQSTWNAKKQFTGWIDVGLTPQGWAEADTAGKLLANYKWDACYTSHLQRAITTLQVILRDSNDDKQPIYIPFEHTIPRQSYTPDAATEFPVFIHCVPLAERHYGDLQGKNKDAVKAEVGDEQFIKWRRGYNTPPPNGESLSDTFERAVPYFCGEILPRLDRGETVLISAHGNSLRALTKYLEGIADDEIVKLNIPTGTPIVYDLRVNAGAVEVLNKEVLEPV